MENLKEQLENKEARSPEDIKKLFPFIVTRNYEEYAGWHNKVVTYTEYGFKKGYDIFWFNRRTNNIDNQSYHYSDVVGICISLKNSDFKFACSFCGQGMLGSPNKFFNPLDLMDYIIKNNFTFDKAMTSLLKIKEGHYAFSGNLNEYSCAFNFHIFDEDLLGQIMKKSGLIIKC